MYRCAPLHLWDMTFPLTAGGSVIGVLFGGQLSGGQATLIGAGNCPTVSDFVDWSTCPAPDNQLEDVRERIKSHSTSVQGADKLLQLLDNPEDNQLVAVSIEDFKTRVSQFLEFGKQTQALFDRAL